MTSCPSPNFGPRRNGLQPELVVIHYTEMASAEAALERLCAPEAQVSAHYMIGANGRLWQLVDEPARAWHAGAGEWLGRGDVNSRSIGIELDNDGRSPFPEAQMRALERLLPGILRRWGIAPSGVIAHSDFAPERKVDPGSRFDWRRLALNGLSIWPYVLGHVDKPLGPSLDRIGYPKVEPALRLAAFRLRFRPGATGPEDAVDRGLAAGVAQQMAVACPDAGNPAAGPRTRRP